MTFAWTPDGTHCMAAITNPGRMTPFSLLPPHNVSIVYVSHLCFYPRDAEHSAVFAVERCPSVCLSVTRRYCVKTKPILKLFDRLVAPSF